MGKGGKGKGGRRTRTGPNAIPLGGAPHQPPGFNDTQPRRRRGRRPSGRHRSEVKLEPKTAGFEDDAAPCGEDGVPGGDFHEPEEMMDEDLHEFPGDPETTTEANLQVDAAPTSTRMARGGWKVRRQRQSQMVKPRQVQQRMQPERPKTAFSGPVRSTISRFGRRSCAPKAKAKQMAESPRQEVYSGQLKNISRNKGYGFISCRETWKDYHRDVLVYPEQVGTLKAGDFIEFHLKLEEGRPVGYNLRRKDASHRSRSPRSPRSRSKRPVSVALKSEVPESTERPSASISPPCKEVKLCPRPKPSLAPQLSAELSKLKQQWRKLQEAQASTPRSYHVHLPHTVQPAEPLLGATGRGVQEVEAKITVSCSLPQTFPSASTPETQALDTKKRSFDELFEKTKARLEELQATPRAGISVVPSQASSCRPTKGSTRASFAAPRLQHEVPQLKRSPDVEEVLLLDVVPASARLVESLRDEILSRPGISKMRFEQPEGNQVAPWRAEILGIHHALEEVKSFLMDTLEFAAVRVVGFDAPNWEDESNLCVTVKGLQEAFGQGGACAALMACGRVLQWIKAGEEAFCWLASAEAVWVAQQFLHGAASSNGQASSVVPDQATQEKVNSWRERRRCDVAKQRGFEGSWRRVTDEELDMELLKDSTIQAAKARLEDFLCYVEQAS